MASLRGRGVPVFRESAAKGDGFPPYLAYDWTPGQTLAARLADNDTNVMPATRETLAARLYVMLRRTLAYLHVEAGVVHGDLCPANLLCRADDDFLLIDFGNARWIDSPVASADLYGLARPSFITPDQARGHWGSASDIYQLGLVIHEVLFGQPFNRGHDFSSCRLEAAAARPFQITDAMGLQAFWISLLQDLLAPDAADRPAAAELPAVPT